MGDRSGEASASRLKLIRTDLVAPLESLGKPARYHVLKTEQGHLGAVYDMGQASGVLRDFLR